jgi:hypothetical protein
MNILDEDDDDTIATTTDDEDDEPVAHLDPVYTSFGSDEEFDPYNSGLNDFTFEDTVDETPEVV